MANSTNNNNCDNNNGRGNGVSHWVVYKHMHDSVPVLFNEWFNTIKDKCRDCGNYKSDVHYGYPIQGCDANEDMTEIEDPCKSKCEKQLTLMEILK